MSSELSHLSDPLKKSEKPTTGPEEIDVARLKLLIKDNLGFLAKTDEKNNQYRITIGRMLSHMREQLDALKTQDPNDPDLYPYEKAYSDFLGDFERGEETELDSSMEEIRDQMGEVIKKSGVKKEKPEESILSDAVQKLRSAGINPEYVVTNGNPHAKTVVLFMQVHPTPPGTPVPKIVKPGGTQASQNEIKDSIIAASNMGLVRDIYDESLPYGMQLESRAMDYIMKNDPRAHSMAGLEAKAKLGEGINVMGYDYDELKMPISESMNKGEKSKGMEYRMNAQNVFIASNMAQLIQSRTENMSFMILGGAHEKNPEDNVNPLPISQALAYYGMNVVVVDAMSSYIQKPTVLASAK